MLPWEQGLVNDVPDKSLLFPEVSHATVKLDLRVSVTLPELINSSVSTGKRNKIH